MLRSLCSAAPAMTGPGRRLDLPRNGEARFPRQSRGAEMRLPGCSSMLVIRFSEVFGICCLVCFEGRCGGLQNVALVCFGEQACSWAGHMSSPVQTFPSKRCGLDASTPASLRYACIVLSRAAAARSFIDM